MRRISYYPEVHFASLVSDRSASALSNVLNRAFNPVTMEDGRSVPFRSVPQFVL